MTRVTDHELMLRPLPPNYTASLLEPLHGELMHLLHGLRYQDWERPTVAAPWRVRDIAAHLLDVQLRTLSAVRDDHLAQPDRPIASHDDLVGFLDQLNADWVVAMRRLSPPVLIELLTVTGPEAAAALAELNPHEPARFAVAWAGEAQSENWMHVGREYTEWWHHQMQIRAAVGAPPLFEARWLRPLLDLSVRALPHTYRALAAEPGASVAIDVAGCGSWSLVRRDAGWEIYEGSPPAPDTRIALDPDTAWQSLYHALDPATARSRARLEGDERLGAPFFQARSVMVLRRG